MLTTWLLRRYRLAQRRRRGEAGSAAAAHSALELTRPAA